MVKAGSDDFTRLVEYTDDYKPGARRFDAGEFASFIHIPMAAAALSQIATWGVENIQETLSLVTGAISAGIKELGWEAPAGESRVGHMLGIRFPPEKIDGIRKELVENNIYISFRGSSMRVAPHLYNDEGDVQRLLEVLRKGR
jgi:selenocysteine lyase/cysteine desulfurase